MNAFRFVARPWWGQSFITKATFVKETPKQILVRCLRKAGHGKNPPLEEVEEREKKHTRDHQWFTSLDEAKSHAIQHFERRVADLKEELAQAKADLETSRNLTEDKIEAYVRRW